MKAFHQVIVWTCALAAWLTFEGSAQARGTSYCCKGDLNGDGVISAPDLTVLLGFWGPVGLFPAADIDGSGVIDASDLTELLGGWGTCPVPCTVTALSGIVAFPNGVPVAGAVIVTEAGGSAVSAENGSFTLEVDVGDLDALQISAVATVEGQTFVGIKEVSSITLDGVTNVGNIVLEPEGTCFPEWLPSLGGLPGVSGTVLAMATFDDGTGPALFVGGEFDVIAGVSAKRIAKWDGVQWSQVGGGLDSAVQAMTVFDDGDGPQLYVGGRFLAGGSGLAICVMRWDGRTWTPFGLSSYVGGVSALEVFEADPIEGPRLYAGGTFQTFTHDADYLLQWTGGSWEPVGAGVDGAVDAFETFDSGSGKSLYVGGSFQQAGGMLAARIARWNGDSWSPVGGGTNGLVRAMAAIEDPQGPRLVVAGDFTIAGGIDATRIAAWDGSSWSSFGPGANGSVSTLSIRPGDAHTGPALIAGGTFTAIGGVPANRLAAWNGSAWAELAGGVPAPGSVVSAVAALSTIDGSSQLFVGGHFQSVGAVSALNIAKLDTEGWSAIATGLSGSVRCFAKTTGSQSAFFAGGYIPTAGGQPTNGVLQWSDNAWVPLNSDIRCDVSAMTMFDDGSGEGLYVGGYFFGLDPEPSFAVARWDGTTWIKIGESMNGPVSCLTAFDDGAGSSLYVGGSFTSVGGVAVSRLAVWRDGMWQQVGGGLSGEPTSMVVFDDGRGPALYIAGQFVTAGEVVTNNIARWDGTSWSSLAGGTDGKVFTMTIYSLAEDGREQLIVGGQLSLAGGVPVQVIAAWDGTSWSAMGAVQNWVLSLSSSEVPESGEKRLLAGGFADIDGQGNPFARLFEWRADEWHPIPGKFNSHIFAIGEFEGTIHVGGPFSLSPSGDSFLTQLRCLSPIQ